MSSTRSRFLAALPWAMIVATPAAAHHVDPMEVIGKAFES